MWSGLQLWAKPLRLSHQFLFVLTSQLHPQVKLPPDVGFVSLAPVSLLGIRHVHLASTGVGVSLSKTILSIFPHPLNIFLQGPNLGIAVQPCHVPIFFHPFTLQLHIIISFCLFLNVSLVNLLISVPIAFTLLEQITQH